MVDPETAATTARAVVAANPGPADWHDLDSRTRAALQRASELAGSDPATLWAASRAFALTAASASDEADRIASEARR